MREALCGEYCRLEPIGISHADDLFCASTVGDAAARFRYLMDQPVADRQSFDTWLAAEMQRTEPLMFAVIDSLTNRCGGRQSLVRIDMLHGVIELGNVFWSSQIARSRISTEAFYLHAEYVFSRLGYRRLEWKCDSNNDPSRQAALRFGFQYEGCFRQHMLVKGCSRDTVWYSILDGDWPLLRSRFQNWLQPSNFDSQGQQKRRLTDL
jgi:RimJ/RimL family protein N-acetyltransferase